MTIAILDLQDIIAKANNVAQYRFGLVAVTPNLVRATASLGPLRFHTLGVDALAVVRHDFSLTRAAAVRPKDWAHHTYIRQPNHKIPFFRDHYVNWH